MGASMLLQNFRRFGRPRRSAAMFAFTSFVVLYLVAWSPPATAERHHNVSHNPTQLQLSRLPFCEQHIGKLHEPARESFRDLLQEWMLQKRVESDNGQLLGRVLDPPADELERHVWRTHLTADQIQWRRDNATVKRAAAEAQLKAAFAGMRQSGLVADSTTVLDLTHCLSGRLNPHAFPDLPVVSFMLQYFKRPHMIDPFVEMVQACNKLMPVEFLVNVDNPSEGQRWANLSWSTKGLVVPVFSFNVHEVRAYNRLASLARGKYLVFLQDDDLLLPLDCSWIEKLVAQFESMPLLGLVGLNTWQLGHGEGNENRNPHILVDPVTKNDVLLAFQVDFAPVAVRKAAFKYIGGLDETLGEPGECGIFSDWEMSIRMWVAGWRVAYMPLIQKQGDQVDKVGGTHRPETGNRCWGRQQGLATATYWARWGNGYGTGPGAFLEQLENHVRIQNLLNLQRKDPAAPCPFRKGCAPAGDPPLPDQYNYSYSGTKPTPIVTLP